MSKICERCPDKDRTNQDRLDPLLFPITYGSNQIITELSLPRRYTSIHNDQLKTIYLSIDHKYNKAMLESEEAVKVQSQVIGRWEKKDGKYRILLTVIVSSPENPQAEIRNFIFCKELGPVLEGIALAESALLKLKPRLSKTKIYIKFKSIDPSYQRVEYWKTLGYWHDRKNKK